MQPPLIVRDETRLQLIRCLLGMQADCKAVRATLSACGNDQSIDPELWDSIDVAESSLVAAIIALEPSKKC